MTIVEGTYTRRWRLSDGSETVYRYKYAHLTAFGRCKAYLRKPGAELMRLPTGKGRNGLWVGRGCPHRFLNRTVKAVIAAGHAVLIDGKVRRR